jgi:FkbM family methyltransferase
MRTGGAWTAALHNLDDAFSLGLDFPLRHLSDLAGRPSYTARVRGVGPVHLRRRSSDASVVRQVFRGRDYDLSRYRQHARVLAALDQTLAQGRTPVIIDGGANIGAASIYFADAYPSAAVLAVEPDPANAEACRRNTAGRSAITVLEAALGSEPGRVALVNPAGEAWAVQTARSEAGTTPVLTIDDVLARVPDAVPLIVKIDIEGFEADLFSRNTEWIDGAAVVIIEPHDWLFPDRRSSRPFQKAMAERDFDLIVSGENLIYIRSA